MPNDDLPEDIESLIDVKPLIIDNKTVHTVTMEYQGVSVIKLYGFYYPNFLVKNVRVPTKRDVKFTGYSCRYKSNKVNISEHAKIPKEVLDNFLDLDHNND